MNFERLNIPITADDRLARSVFARARGQTSLFARQVSGDLAKVEVRMMRMQAATLSAGAAMTRLVGLAGVGFAVVGLVKLSDSFTRINNQLQVAGLEGDELRKVYDRLFQSAQRNAAPLESLAELYGRAALVQKELGVSTEELLNFTDKIAVALRVSGKSAAESSGSLLQLSQALGSGVVRAEEFNSILEGALPIAQAAAAGLEEAGGSVAKLRQLVIDGKVSSEAFFRAFEAGAGTLEARTTGMSLTVGQAFTTLWNSLTDTVGQIDRTTGASATLVREIQILGTWIEWLGDHFDTLTAPIRTVAEGYDFLAQKMLAVRQALGIEQFFEDTALIDGRIRGINVTDATKAIEARAAAIDKLRESLAATSAAGERLALDPDMEARFAAAFGGVVPVSLKDFKPPASTSSAKGSATAPVTAEIITLGKAIEETAQRMNDLESATRSAFGALISGLMEGKNFTESLSDAVGRLAEQLLNMALDQAVSGLFAGIRGAVGLTVPAATGGAMFARGGIATRPSIFGEGPLPEAAVPLPDGRTIPVTISAPSSMGAMVPTAPTIHVSYAPKIDARGADPAAIARLRGEMVRDVEERLPGMIRQAGADNRL